MKIRAVLIISLIALPVMVLAATKSYEYPRAESLPEDDTSVFPRDPTLLTGHDVKLTAERFFNAWNNKKNERERIKADMYFLGVLDATEGKRWCDYKKILPSSAHEYIYSSLSKMKSEEREQPAAEYIVRSMADILPCAERSKK
ncbi:Rap1a/Tai family immunity protein [Kosakonia cowanii]|uniref:Rap1a/Tai family immunity protein n=1 Tax=Kosakonia cowanii TaxID=208223 RepID=UPI0023F97EDE|nr:Rap1a/Tai family immunity protein [Kosakonia cowanii]MDF7760270.1 Rap1a/Tai family immunity protein [Kosakonia cowanii]